MEKSSNKEEKQQQQGNRMSMPPKPRGSDEPWLVFFHGKRGQKQTFYSISEGGNYHVKNIPLLRHTFICTCSHGWMVLRGTCSDDDECFLLNPTTMEKIQLPPLDFQFKRCVLSSSPTDPTCTLLFISCPRDDVIIFRFCSPQISGNVDRWIKQEVKFQDACRLTGATSCDGKIYGFSGGFDDILIIEAVDTTTLRVRKMGIESQLPLLNEALPYNTEFFESCGELFVVRRIYEESCRPYEIIDFEVFKLDFARKCWERVESLGNRAFFFGRDSCCSAFAKESESECGIMGNTIYFTMNEDRSLYAFNVEEKSIRLSLPCPNVQHNWSQPNWFLPSCS